LPSVERVLRELANAGAGTVPRAVVAECARRAVAEARRRAGDAAHAAVGLDAVVADAKARVDAVQAALLGPVVNATGVLLHTNLGRAPLGASTRAAMADAGGYTNIEYRLDTGGRGSRQDHGAALLALACGAEAGFVVNNNAAAVLLVLATLAREREVLVSRGELVEIGGGFRVPDILAETGARLVEVGTTNRTRRADYERSITERTALVLKVHASNYRMVGFTETTSVADLATLGPPVVVDAGSGLLDERTPWLTNGLTNGLMNGHENGHATSPEWLADEPGVRQCLQAGAALVTFSGDKLLGGPQAGIVVGRADLVALLARHPLARALRPDKVTLAGLEAVALAYLDDDAAAIPFWRMATASVDSLRDRAATIVAAVPEATVVGTASAAGGGSVPGRTIASAGVAVVVADVDAALRALRSVRVVALGRDGAVVCDLRTVDPAEDERVVAALRTLATG
jgi:L-seryl-tRNA(Ser) seleniumtransferase